MEIDIVVAQDARGREQAAERGAQVLSAGGIIVHPTETVYGLGGDGSPGNNELIARVKRREERQPLILLVTGIETARSELRDLDWPEAAQRLADRFWPGPLTLVLRCPGADPSLQGPGEGVAVRVSPEPTVLALLGRWRRPLTSTSANRAGGTPARRLSDALPLFRDRPDLADSEVPVLAIDAGLTVGTLPSTIVSFVESPPRLLREGPVARREIESLLPELQ
ncbi:MAG: L-threonylcarbamoyladenylate synthase [Gemmatimonadota bacterium]|nr:MAG: L-threonylcarbamoyladenylate synthase [Gemmatimonadota bacterium]